MIVMIGIDPGVTGAVGCLCESAPEPLIWDMPANPRDLYERLSGFNSNVALQVVVEQAQAMPRQGVSSTFKTGYGYGVIIGVLAATGIPYRTVTPAVWKRAMGLQGKDKEASRALARSLWPTAPLGRVKDHGRAEALLLAEFGRRNWRD